MKYFNYFAKEDEVGINLKKIFNHNKKNMRKVYSLGKYI